MNGKRKMAGRRSADGVGGRSFLGGMPRGLILAGVGLIALGVAGCATVTRKPPLPQADDFARPRDEIYTRYPALRDYAASATPWAREVYLDVPYVLQNWGPPTRREMSWWTVGGLLFVRPAYWYWWDKGRYRVGLYYEKHLVHGWQPVGVRVELRERAAGEK